MKKMIFTILLMLGPIAQATGGQEVGNGGDVVYCGTGPGQVTLLDYYEATAIKGMTLDLGGNQMGVEDKVKLLISRMNTGPETKSVLLKKLSTFFSEAAILPNVTLVDTDDSKHIVIPTGCSIQQIAIQKEPQFAFDKRYTISKDLWDLLDNGGKAGLMFHEILYGLNLSASDSLAVRAMNGVTAANLLNLLSLAEAKELYRAVHLSSLYYKNLKVNLGTPWSPGTIDLLEPAIVDFGGGKVKLSTFYIDSQSAIVGIHRGEVIKTVRYRDTLGQNFECGPGPLSMLNGRVSTCFQLAGDVDIKVLNGSELKFMATCQGRGNLISYDGPWACKSVPGKDVELHIDALSFKATDKVDFKITDDDLCINTFGREIPTALSFRIPILFRGDGTCGKLEIKSENGFGGTPYLKDRDWGKVATSYYWAANSWVEVALFKNPNKQPYFQAVKGVTGGGDFKKPDGTMVHVPSGKTVELDANERLIKFY